MNQMTAWCGHLVVVTGAPYSQMMVLLEQQPCAECSLLVHCNKCVIFDSDCHWCNLMKAAYLRMTQTERKLHFGVE